MTLRQLQYLVAVADERQFTRAAAREHVAQPALSQQIRALEQEIGLPLLERSTRHVALTQAGGVLVARTRRILAELDAARDELQALAGVEAGRVTVGTTHTMGPVDISLVLSRFRERHPGIELTVREDSSEELAEMVRADELDLAFLSVTERIRSHRLGLHRLITEKLVVILPNAHRLAGRRRIRMRELAEEQFIAFREGARLRELLSTAGRQAGFTPLVTLESNETLRIRRLVARDMGVSILPASDAFAPGPDVAVADLVEPTLVRDITLAWREDRRPSPAAREFLELARSLFTASGEATGRAVAAPAG